MKTLLQAGFDAYTAIEDFVYEKVFLPEEPQADFDDAKAFAALAHGEDWIILTDINYI